MRDKPERILNGIVTKIKQVYRSETKQELRNQNIMWKKQKKKKHAES